MSQFREDRRLAEMYLAKIRSSKDRGIDFSLTLSEYKRFSKLKTCYYTGLTLNSKTRTLDRIDNKVGYITGNVVVCHTTFNALKGLVENPRNELNLKNTLRGITRWNKL
jgi:hypothetical protein